jgi:hypothetical protein
MPMKMRSHILSPSVVRGITAVCAAAVVASAASAALAAGVVGAGTAVSCTDAALDAALAGGGLVTFNCGGPALIDISIGTGTKTIGADTTVDGGGLITISGGHSARVFSVPQDVHFTVRNVRIAGGRSNNGGGIANTGGGSLTVTNSTFTGNSADGSPGTGGIGGGILNSGGGSVTVTDSTFTGNSAGGDPGTTGIGGGIFTNGGGSLTITNSTFAGNSAGAGGAILGLRGSVTVTNSTFTDNSADTGGGILSGTLTVTNSTFTGNSNGGIDSGASGSVAVRNTILANSPSGGNCIGSITDGGHNLEDGTSCGFLTGNGSLSGTNPQLDPLRSQNNGGLTQTVALCTGAGTPPGCIAASPAIDAGDQAVCDAAPVNGLDQRGFVRPGTGHTQCSIGAFEADATAPEACTGDCDGRGSVAVDDLLTLVNIALGNAQPSACPQGIPRGAEVDVALILQAVNNALSGCGG